MSQYGKRWTTENWEITLTWGDLFGLIAPHIQNSPSNDYAQTKIGSVLQERANFGRTITIKDYDFQTIKVHLEAIGLIVVQRANTTNGGSAMFWRLTEVGKELMRKMRSVRK